MKLSDAAGTLATLQYRDYQLKELVDIGKSVQNLKQNTLSLIQTPIPYDSTNDLVSLKDLKVCIKYQRKMRLLKVIDKLKSYGGFNKEAAGHIDIAIRPDGSMYVWDGFRRAFMAALVGLESMPASIYKHPENRTIKQCEEYEAQMFKIRNADTETMKQEEILRSKWVYRDPEAIAFVDFLNECGLDVEGLNPGNVLLGGMVQFFTCWKFNHIKSKNLINASKIIRNTWKTAPLISGYLLCGLGKFLDVNEEINSSNGLDDIQEAFYDFVNTKPPMKQDVLTGRRLNKSPNESIAYCIATLVLGLEGNELKEIASLLNLDKQDIELIEEA